MNDIEKLKNKGILRELFNFLLERKSWWIIPIVVVLVVVAFLIVLMQSNYISPFIYILG